MSRIVIVEDNLQNARLACRILRRDGHEVLVAEDGEAGLMMILQTLPDLILMDLGLPDIDGQTIVAMLRQQPHLAQVPILAFTAWPEGAAQQMAQAYGFTGLLTKPINTRTFAGQVGEYLGRGRVTGLPETAPHLPIDGDIG